MGQHKYIDAGVYDNSKYITNDHFADDIDNPRGRLHEHVCAYFKFVGSDDNHNEHKYLEHVRAVYDAAANILNVDTRHDHYDIHPNEHELTLNQHVHHNHTIDDRCPDDCPGYDQRDDQLATHHFERPDDVDVAVYDLVARDDINNLRAALNKHINVNLNDDVTPAAYQLVDNVRTADEHTNNLIRTAHNTHNLWALRAAYIDAHAQFDNGDHAAGSADALKSARAALVAANRVER